MRLHQVLTGSCNEKSCHASLGTINEFSFIAYASGCDVIILNESFLRVQVIPGSKLGNLIVAAVSCNKGNGKIAVANANGIYVYSPHLSINGSLHSSLSNVSWSLSRHVTVQNDSRVACLSWSYEPFLSNRRSGLLSAFNDGSLVAWRPYDDDLELLDDSLSPSTKFHIGSSSANSECTSVDANSLKESANNSYLLQPPLAGAWKSVVIGRAPGVPKLIEFSTDGRYFATLSESNGMSTARTSTVLVWFRDLPNFSCGKDPIDMEQEEKWEHVVLSHPSRVISFSWRLCSRYLPPGWMPNVLVTSSEDHVCRVWVEVTNHGSDSLGSSISNDRYSKSWTYGHMESTATITLPVGHNNVPSAVVTTTETHATGPVDACLPARFTYPLPPTLLHHPVLHQLLELWLLDPFSDAQVNIEFARSNASNCNDRLAPSHRSYPRFAFATSLALENPSNPNAELSGSSGQFVVHWLNNKMYRFDERMKSLLLDSVARSFAIPMDGVSSLPADSSQMASLADHLGLFDQSLATLLGEWQHAPDVVLSIHPADGSLIVWYVHGLDMSVSNPAGVRTQYTPLLQDGLRRMHLESAFTVTPNLGCKLTHVTTSLRSRLHEAFPSGEAASVLPGIFLFLTATPKSRYSLQMLQTGCTPTSDLFASRDISTLFCRLLVLNHSLQLLSRNPTGQDISSAGQVDGRRVWKQSVLNGLSEAQLLWSSFDTKVHRAQYVAMVTRHVNGSLRYWRLDVSASSHFQWIVSVNGSARLSGHRFHTEAIVPHPLLPLVLTSSHYSHSSLCEAAPVESIQSTLATISSATSESHSEVILWRVGPVGPLTSTTGSLEQCSTHCHHNTDPKRQAQFTNNLSDSSNVNGGTFSEGGLFEVARIDVSEPGQSHTWFDDLAWFPCMVTTSLTPYPVALFLGNLSSLSDVPGTGQLGFFLAFADTGEDLSVSLNKAHEDRFATEPNRFASLANSDTSGCILQLRPTLPSSSRIGRTCPPGKQCAIPETLLLHVFPSELIPGTKLDQSNAQSTENRLHSTYLIVRLTRWQFAPHQASTRSESKATDSEETRLEMWRVNVIAETGFATDSGASELSSPVSLSSFDELLFGMEKLCDCELPLPEEVSMIRAEVSAAHVSWAALSTYNAPPPYLIVSACTDGCLRFWRCDVLPSSDQLADSPQQQSTTQLRCVWSEWQMPLTYTLSSCIELDSRRAPKVLDIDCAYSGRVAVAYAPRGDDRLTNGHCTSALVDPTMSKVLVAVYECESSGGCEWILEDTIDLTADLRHNSKIPVCVQLDWVSTEDGGHLLSIMLGSRVLVYAATCQNVTTSSAQGHPQTASTLMTSLGEVYLSWIRVATTHVHTTYVPDPATSSTESPIPISGRHRRVIWLRDGLLLVGVSAEMHVYSQWPSETTGGHVETIPIISAPHALPSSKKKTNDNAPSDIIDSVKVTEGDVNDATVSTSASLTVARLTKTYSAYLLKPSPSSALLASPVANATALSPVIPSANKSVATNALPSGTAGGPHSTVQPTVTAPSVDAMYSSLLPNLGLFESIQVFNPVLPQFHPRQLLEWMNFGRLRRIQTILAHLTRCLSALTPVSTLVGPRNSRNARATSVSNSTHQSSRRVSLVTELTGSAPPNNPASSAPSNNVGPAGGAPGGTMLEAQAIPPVPLYVLLAVDSLQAEDLVTSESEHATAFDPMDEMTPFTPTQESELFKIQEDTESLSDNEACSPFSQTDLGTHGKYRIAGHGSSTGNKVNSSCAAMSMWSLKPTSLAAISQFRPEDARLLAEHLAIRQLPGLSPLDQMYLLGIADLMANTQTDITERLSGLEPRKKKNEEDNTSMSESTKAADVRFHAQPNQGLDECGLRFLLTVQLYSYLSRTLPPARRAQLLSSGLTNSSSAWAFHSDAEEELLARIPTKQFAAGSEELTWIEFKRYGCGWWIRSDALLRRCAEKIARTAFQSTKDPMESAVFYLAMHKAKILAGLFKSIGNKTLENFFRSDFNPGSPACRQAKLNAFRLLSQHRYMQAAGLFLLADCLDDAVRVCLDTLKDLQLAVVLARLYTTTVPVPENRSTDSPYLRLLRQHVVANEDPFIRSMAFWTLGDPLAALQTLLEGPQPIDHTSTPNSPSNPSAEAQSPQHPQSLGCKPTLIGSVDSDNLPNSRSCGNKTSTSVYPSVFKFYTYLRTHPLVVRQCRLIAPTGADHYALRRLNSLERRLCFRTAHHYSALGCPALALEVLSKIPALVPSKDLSSVQSDDVSNTSVSGDLVTLKPCSSIPLLSGTNPSVSRPQPRPDDNIFSWSAVDAFEPTQSSTGRDRFQIEWSDDEKEGTPARAPFRSDTIPSVRESGAEAISNADEVVVDLIANQLKFIACLKILSEELSTLAAGAESEGVGLRQHVWHWLEHELAVVHTLTASNQQNRLICAPDNPDQLRFTVDTLIGQQYAAPEPAVSGWMPLNKETVGLNDHHCAMNQGPLTTPSFLLSLTPCPSYFGQTHTYPQLALNPSSQQNDNATTTAAGILLSGSAVSLELREAEHNRLRTRHRWLKAHEAFLTSLINFCGLYGASGVGLPAVRIELLLLLTELHTYPKCPGLVLSSAHSQPDVVPNQSDSSLTPWSTCTMGLVDGIPLLRTVLHLHPGALLLPDPIQHIQCMIQDLMACLETLPPPYLTTAILPYPYEPNKTATVSTEPTEAAISASPFCAACARAPTPHRQRRVFLLRNLCAALAVCVHQSLSTGGWFGPGQSSPGIQGIALPASGVMTARSVERLLATKQLLKPNTEPSRWPGLTSLRKYIHAQYETPRSKPAMIPVMSSVMTKKGPSTTLTATTTALRCVNRRYLVGLLAQALAATFLGLVVYAMHTRDACALYRLISVHLDSTTWGKVFGGAYRAKPFRPTAPPGARVSESDSPRAPSKSPAQPPSRPPARPQPRPGATGRYIEIRSGRRKQSTSDSSSIPEEVLHSSGSSKTPQRQATPEQSGNSPLPVSGGGMAIKDSETIAATDISSTLPPPPPDEWFVPPQCSMLTCLLERPNKHGALPDDPSRIFDSDDSDPPSGYISYHEAIAGQKRRARQAVRHAQYRRTTSAKREAQRKAKEELRRRLAKHAGLADSSDEDDVNHVVARIEDLYPELSQETEAAETQTDSKTTESVLQPRWILRLLHLDPDFGDVCYDTGSGGGAEELCVSSSSGDNETGFYLPEESSGEESGSGFDESSLHGDLSKTRVLEVERQWIAGDSYAWRLMRLGILQLVKGEIERLIQLLDFGADDLAVHAPGLVTATRLVEVWLTSYRLGLTAPPALTPKDLNRRVIATPDSHLLPPPQFIPGMELDLTVNPGATIAPGVRVDATEQSPQLPSVGATRAMLRLRHLIDPTKTPFQTRDPFSLPAKRLWCYLVRQPNVDDMFTRHVFRKPRSVQCVIVPNSTSTVGAAVTTAVGATSHPAEHPAFTASPVSGVGKFHGGTSDEHHKFGQGKTTRHHHHQQQQLQQQTHSISGNANSLLFDDSIRLVHKEQDPLIAMCINQSFMNSANLSRQSWTEVNYSCIAIATPKEVIELNVDNLISLPAWYADEVEYDLELMRRPQRRVYPDGDTDDFIVLDASSNLVGGAGQETSGQAHAGGTGSHNVPTSHVILKRTLPAVYSLAAHPTFPYYLSGTGTGSVHLFEWATAMPVVAGFTNTYALTSAGASGQFPAGSRGARVTAIRFDDSGRRFGLGDAEGNFGLWNMQSTTPEKPPYFRCRCHAKGLADFCFVGSSTLVATVGNGGGASSSTGPLLSGVNATSQVTGGEAGSSFGTGVASVFGVEQDGANLTLWDTLLPPRRCGVIRVTDPELESPCTAVTHLVPSVNSTGWPACFPIASNGLERSPNSTGTAIGSLVGTARDRVVVVGTKRGDVCFVDLRKPAVLFSFAAHESAVRTLCVDTATDCVLTGGADGNVKIWRLSEHELITSFCGDFYQGRGAAAVAAAALFRGNQSAAIIAATNPGIAEIQLLPLVTGISLLNQGGGKLAEGSGQNGSVQQLQQNKYSLAAASSACRFLSCGADGGLRMRSLVVRPKPFRVC